LGRKIFAGALVFFIVTILSAGSVWAVEKKPDDRLMAADYSMVGLRLGAWIAQTAAPKVTDVSVDADMPDAGFYTELFLDYRLVPVLMLEFSMGIASRGDAVIRYADDRYIGTINLYPLLFQVKLAPLAGRVRSVSPFIIGGGGVVWGRQNTDFVSSADPFYNPDIVNKTESDFIGVIGGGVDIALAEQLGLNVTVKYHPITFGNPLAGVDKYSGTAVSVGVAYFLHKK
jgi:hypothetical protein